MFPEADTRLLNLLRTLNSARVATWCWIRADVPEMRRLARHLASPATDHQFHTGLRWLLDGIAAQSAQTG